MISPEHQAMLAASGITLELAEARGYETITDKQRLIELGFTAKNRTPGLLVPGHRKDGSIAGYQYRADQPPAKGPKYISPKGQRNYIDVPVGWGEKLDDPKVALLATEGAKKADSAAAHQILCVSINGVWGWRGTNSQGGRSALGDWDDIALNGRLVVLAFDSDVVREPTVRKALTALANYLISKGAHVEYLHLPDSDDGKCGLDDFLVGHTVEELWELVSPEVPGEPIDGAEFLDDLVTWWARFIAVTQDDDLPLLALWAVHTHLVNELYTTPRLLIDSIMEGSGKSTVIDHLNRLCVHPVQAASISSPALIPRLLESGMRTILIDEAHRALRPDKPGVEDLLGIINTGYRHGATRPVLVPTKGGGWDAAEMPTYAPLAMAGNHPNLPPDTVSRQIRILLMPDLDGTVEDSDWEHIEGQAAKLKARIAAFAHWVRGDIKGMDVDLPTGCIGRCKEKWRPLARVANAAGGHWPEIARRLIEADMAQEEAEREAGLKKLPPGMVVMRDLWLIWPEGDAFMPTRQLVTKLIGHNTDYWGAESNYGKQLTETRLGLLIDQATKLTSSRPGGRGPRGYLRTMLEPVWHRLGMGRRQPGAPGEPGEPGAEQPHITGLTDLTDCTGLFETPTEPGADEPPPRCACGNRLLTPEARARGTCKPCADASKQPGKEPAT